MICKTAMAITLFGYILLVSSSFFCCFYYTLLCFYIIEPHEGMASLSADFHQAQMLHLPTLAEVKVNASQINPKINGSPMTNAANCHQVT